MIRSNIIPNLIRSNSISLMDLSGKKTASLRPIASYKCYDKTNEDEDRSVLRDLTGNGHDIQLYNFAFAESSGYGKYGTNFNDWYIDTSQSDVSKTSTSFIISASVKEYIVSSSCRLSSNTTSFTFKFRIVKCDGANINLKIYNFPVEGNTEEEVAVSDIKVGQVYSYTFEDLPTGYTRRNIYFTVQNAKYLEVEQIPDYQGALVSDGVDDYGLCDNFPILTKENGYTVFAIRKNLQDIVGINQCFISNRKRNQSSGGAFNIEIAFKTNLSNVRTDNFDSTKWLDKSLYPNLFTYQTSKKYNGNTLEIGTSEGNNEFNLFQLGNSFDYVFKGAFYALEIYDRDLTDEEIEKVKARMIAEYEAKTGDVSMSVVASYECYDKTNEDSDRDILTDLSGNGHDINLKNFLFSEGSGYGKYTINFLNSYSIVSSRGTASVYYNKIIITSSIINYSSPIIQSSALENIPSFTVKVTGIKSERLAYRYTNANGIINFLIITNDGMYNIPASYQTEESRWSGWGLDKVDSCNIIIEQIPEYKGALVSDGVDDYGLCDNFPILTKDKGYTICVIRQWVNYLKTNSVFLSNGNNNNVGAFKLETHLPNDSVVYRTYSFGRSNTLNEFDKNMFIYQTANKYNGNAIVTGDANGINELKLFCNESNNWRSSVALYALEIYDRDLTDKEIEVVKERMIKRYEEKTGNKYEEVTE